MLAVIMLLGATIAGIIASGKNRNVVGWAAAGFCFPLISILIVACQPALPPPAAAVPPLPDRAV